MGQVVVAQHRRHVGPRGQPPDPVPAVGQLVLRDPVEDVAGEREVALAEVHGRDAHGQADVPSVAIGSLHEW